MWQDTDRGGGLDDLGEHLPGAQRHGEGRGQLRGHRHHRRDRLRHQRGGHHGGRPRVVVQVGQVSLGLLAGHDPHRPGHVTRDTRTRVWRLVLQKVASELHPKVRNHREGPY